MVAKARKTAWGQGWRLVPSSGQTPFSEVTVATVATVAGEAVKKVIKNVAKSQIPL